jgi:ribosomal protein RSM22 (predicted rRNA methylase)
MNESQAMDSVTPSDLFTNVNLVDLLKKSIQEGEKQYKLTGKVEGNETKETRWKKLLNEAIEVEEAFVQSNDDKLGLELVRGDRNRKRFGRIIRAPIKKRGHVLVDFCSSGLERDGKIVRHRISRGKSIRLAPGMFGASRKARWGGLWPDIRR